MKAMRYISLLAVFLLLISVVFSLPVSAGKKTVSSKLIVNKEGDSILNDTDWNITDSSVSKKGNSIVISSESATADSKIISKTIVKPGDNVDKIAEVSANLNITALPNAGKFVFAFGLAGIEADLGEDGNIEVFFTNDSGIKVGVTTYSEEGLKTLLEPKNCGLALGRDFAVKLILTSSGTLEATVNNANLGSLALPVSGKGRFGILQTGSCGAVISNLSYTCNYYETPENTDIFEDFEKGEFNANLFVSSSNDNGVFPSGVFIEDYNGSKVLRFKNTKLAHFCTLHQYSNFEISFDIPYISRQYFYDEYGNVSGKPCSHLAVGFGEETSTPVGYSYVSDVDLVCFTPTVVRSEFLKAFRVVITDMGITDQSTNEGYSVKLRVVDGHYDVSVKSLTASDYKIIATADFDAQRSGYVNIWSSGDGDFSIDNLRITNLDENPNKIEVEYKSSLIKAEDYVPTKEESEKKFRPAQASGMGIFKDKIFILDICLISGGILLCVSGLVFYLIRKKRMAGDKNEN